MLEVVEFALMVGIDMLFVAVLILVMLPLGMYRAAAFAVMKRNFVGYFSNPTGYVFLCLFVLLTAFAAFWPHEFFIANLANFDQLNKFLPYIMLVFIPAITMSIWAEERRQGTDELLLTFPARDFDIVIGKYFAAVLVFTVSMLFSQLSNYAVLIAMTGGQLDTGLLFSTYLGYWFIGIAMLAIGMVASFLTNNLTIGFIFGAAFNAPLAFFSNADVIFSNSTVVRTLFDWSLLQRFEPFGRGLIALSSIVYFVGIVVLGVYLSLVLIGRRHWMGGRDGSNLLGHYIIRIVCFVVIAISAVLVAQQRPLNRLRLDVSAERVSTLSPETRTQLAALTGIGSDEQTITIECFISDNIPTEYVQTKYELINRLREFEALGNSRIRVILNNGISPVGEEANKASKQYGIRAVPVQVTARGSQRTENIVMGAAFTRGLDRVVVPFFDYGMRVEYELIRSLNSLKQSDRKTVGVVMTDAYPEGIRLRVRNQPVQIPRMLFIDELRKQYNVEMVEASEPINIFLEDNETGAIGQKRRYDALLVIQPSKMSKAEMTNLIAAIETGQPTAIFEDPAPIMFRFTPNQNSRPQPYLLGTSMDRMFGRQNSAPRDVGDINKLYDALGIVTQGTTIRVPEQQGSTKMVERFFAASVVSGVDNKYTRVKDFESDEFVQIRNVAGADETRFSLEDPVTKDLSELMVVKPGSIGPSPAQKNINFEILVRTANASWIWPADRQPDKSDNVASSHAICARITGKNKNGAPINAIVMADVDFISNQFLVWRNRPNQMGENFEFENVHFAMNVIDSLVGVDDYLEIRNRRIRHSTLEKIAEVTQNAWKVFEEKVNQMEIDVSDAEREERRKADEDTRTIKTQIAALKRKQDLGQPIDGGLLKQKEDMLEQIQREQNIRIQNKVRTLQEKMIEDQRDIYLNAESKIQDEQSKYKLGAVTYPAIPPLLVGLIVFVRRRLKERSGISKARRLK